MRRIRYSVAMSLDGFIAGPQGEYDWIPDEPEIDWATFMDRFDTVLMGRVSYQATLSAPGGSALPPITTYVFSRTLRPTDHPRVTVVSDRMDETIDQLRRAAGKEIWLFGGGNLFRSMLARGHVDIVEIGLVPILLGKGIRFLPETDHQTPLRLESHRHFSRSGILLVTYEVRPDSARNLGAGP